MKVRRLEPAHAATAVDVLCDAFHDYPVMRHVLGDVPGYDDRLRTLIGFFVAARVLRDEPVLVVEENGVAAGAAIVTLPGERPAPQALSVRREETWKKLGSEERARYEALGEVWGRATIEPPHHHLNMIGVRGSHAGRGVGRVLLEAVHAMSEADPGSHGVSLSTEIATNVPFYERFGYRVLKHLQAAGGIDVWLFFRPRETPQR